MCSDGSFRRRGNATQPPGGEHICGLTKIINRNSSSSSFGEIQRRRRTEKFIDAQNIHNGLKPIGAQNNQAQLHPSSGAPPRRAWEAPAKWPPNPRAYLFGARAASAVRTLLVPAPGDAASCPPCLGCPRVSSRSPLHARGALQGRPRGRALASTCMSWQLDAADAGSARPTAHPAERV